MQHLENHLLVLKLAPHNVPLDRMAHPQSDIMQYHSLFMNILELFLSTILRQLGGAISNYLAVEQLLLVAATGSEMCISLVLVLCKLLELLSLNTGNKRLSRNKCHSRMQKR